jgi:hypothetical protein
MTNNNRVSTTLTEQDTQEILAAIGAVRAKLPFLTSLTGAERRRMAKMGGKSVGFDEKCMAYMQSNPEFVPAFVPFAEVQKDREVRTQIMRFAADLNALSSQVADTLLGLSSEIWQADLAYYRSVQSAAQTGQPAARLIADDLAGRFAKVSRKPAPPAEALAA